MSLDSAVDKVFHHKARFFSFFVRRLFFVFSLFLCLLLIKLFTIGSLPSDNSTSEPPYAEQIRAAS
jgi:hypothetical protein